MMVSLVMLSRDRLVWSNRASEVGSLDSPLLNSVESTTLLCCLRWDAIDENEDEIKTTMVMGVRSCEIDSDRKICRFLGFAFLYFV
jgi:hypothetical protein